MTNAAEGCRVCGFCGDIGCDRCAEADAMTAEEYASAFPWLVSSAPTTHPNECPTCAACCAACAESPGWHAGLHVGHIWTDVRCPAYYSQDPADCDCVARAQHAAAMAANRAESDRAHAERRAVLRQRYADTGRL